MRVVGWFAIAAEEALSFPARLASDVTKTGARSPARLFADPAEEGSDDAWPTIRLTASLFETPQVHQGREGASVMWGPVAACCRSRQQSCRTQPKSQQRRTATAILTAPISA